MCSAALALAACTQVTQPNNIEPVLTGNGYQAQYRDPDVPEDRAYLVSAEMNSRGCKPFRGGSHGKPDAVHALTGERLSRNDLLDVRVGEDEVFSGSYVVSRDGMLKLPFLAPIRAQGRSPEEVEKDLARALMQDGYYEHTPRLSVRVADYAGVRVGVSGAVFEPHAIEVGSVRGDVLDTVRQVSLGSSNEGRNLSYALRLAGGVRPDADLSAIDLHRGGKVYSLDLRGVFEGRNLVDVMLIAGDEIVVHSRECFQDDLMRPSPISPPGASLFLSNLTQPATGNAPSAVGRDVREVPYGTRFLQAVIDTNCVGGSRGSSAHRSAILYTRNPVTDVSTVVERNIEDMLRRADRDDFDPYVLPGDGIACYDSTLTNVAEAARIIGAVAGTAALMR